MDLFHTLPLKINRGIRLKISAKSQARVASCKFAVFLLETVECVGIFRCSVGILKLARFWL